MNDDELMHYGTPRHSGRYPWGSGENPYQSSTGLYGMAKQLKSQGMSDKEIAESFGMSTREYKSAYSNAKNEVRAANRAEALRLKDILTPLLVNEWVLTNLLFAAGWMRILPSDQVFLKTQQKL